MAPTTWVVLRVMAKDLDRDDVTQFLTDSCRRS